MNFLIIWLALGTILVIALHVLKDWFTVKHEVIPRTISFLLPIWLYVSFILSIYFFVVEYVL